MRALLHLLSVILVLPGVALAGAFLILGHAIASRSLPGFFGELVAAALWLIPWGVLGIGAALVLLLLAGASPRYRWLGGLCVLLLALGSTCVLLALTSAHAGIAAGDLWFHLPALAGAAIGAWLLSSEWPRAAAGNAAQGVPP